MVTKYLALELLGSESIRAGGADRRWCFYSVPAIPAPVTIVPVLVDETLDVLQVAPPLASSVS